jgi:hypothetical protein
MKKAMLLWRFYDAPEEYRALSDHGGDEDWILFVPWCAFKDIDFHVNNIDKEEYLPDWLDSIVSSGWFGCAGYCHGEVKTGMVYIGAHA